MNTLSDHAPEPSGAAGRLDTEQLQTLRRLTALEGDMAAMVAASTDSNADDEHDSEGATIAFERSQLDALILQTRQHVDEIKRARERLAKGTYETCASCGEAIGEARLEARPIASTCINCAELS